MAEAGLVEAHQLLETEAEEGVVPAPLRRPQPLPGRPGQGLPAEARRQAGSDGGGQIRRAPQQPAHQVTRSGMHQGGGPAESHHPLGEIGQRRIHREQAELLVLHLQHRRTPLCQTAMQPVPQQRTRYRRCQGEGRLLHEEAALAQIHRIEESRGLAAALLVREVIGPVVHEHELPGRDRRRGEAADDAVGRLAGDGAIGRAPHEHRLMAGGIDHQLRPDRLAIPGGHGRFHGVVAEVRRCSPPPAQTRRGAGLQATALQGHLVEQPVVAAVAGGFGALLTASAEVTHRVAPAVGQQMREAQGIHLLPPDAVGVDPGRLRLGCAEGLHRHAPPAQFGGDGEGGGAGPDHEHVGGGQSRERRNPNRSMPRRDPGADFAVTNGNPAPPAHEPGQRAGGQSSSIGRLPLLLRPPGRLAAASGRTITAGEADRLSWPRIPPR